jgi:hypothetical protein
MHLDRFNRLLTPVANIGVLIGIFLVALELNLSRDAIRAQTRNDIQVRLSTAPTSDVMDAVGGQVVLDLQLDDPHECFMEEPAMKALAEAALDFSEVAETTDT